MGFFFFFSFLFSRSSSSVVGGAAKQNKTLPLSLPHTSRILPMCSLSLRAFSYLARSESALKVELAASQTYLYSRSEIGSWLFIFVEIFFFFQRRVLR